RTPVAISLTEGYLMSYYKKEWFYSPGDVSFLCYVLSRIVVKAILDMPYIKQGRVKGELVKVLSPKEPLSKLYAGKLEILEEYRNYGNIILYNSAGALVWFRQNGFYADIMMGSLSEELLEEILTVELNVVWKEDKK
ncbi:MAG: hypothetical protein IJ379_09075, partial [Lachnospiraceae bacterium]|nr:hypothetical protein [Lachnospiraceae bacterium]